MINPSKARLDDFFVDAGIPEIHNADDSFSVHVFLDNTHIFSENKVRYKLLCTGAEVLALCSKT